MTTFGHKLLSIMHLHFSSVTSQFQFGFSTAGLNKKCTSIHMSPQRTVQWNIYISPLLKHDLNGILLLKPLLGLNRQNTKVSIWFYACHCYRGLKTMLPISVAFSAVTFWQIRGFCCNVNAESTTDCRKGYEKGRPLTVSLCSNFSSEDIRLFWKVERELLGLPCFFLHQLCNIL